MGTAERLDDLTLPPISKNNCQKEPLSLSRRALWRIKEVVAKIRFPRVDVIAGRRGDLARIQSPRS
jgi:hypothetical protein